MDQIVVDVSDIDGVTAGDLATIIGRQRDDEIAAGEVAGWVGTISYEVVTGLAPRVARAYLQRGRLAGVTDLLGSRQMASAADDAIYRWSDVPTRWRSLAVPERRVAGDRRCHVAVRCLASSSRP